LHTLSAYATSARLTLAQLSVPEKTNEITAIPDLLDHLAETKQLEGALVSIDAMGCQVEIADRIVAHKADYLLALKGNQPTLEADVEDYFRTAPAEELLSKTAVEKGHGRIETRTYAASSTVDRIASERSYPGQPRFGNIKTILKVHARVEYADRCSFDTRYISPPRLSILSGSPRARAAIGASRACIGCSTSNSRTNSRATAPATAKKIWRSSAASLSAWCAPIKQTEASKHAAKPQVGTRTSCSKSCSSNDR
jgi:predicted transposase YbfD/YdcC